MFSFDMNFARCLVTRLASSPLGVYNEWHHNDIILIECTGCGYKHNSSALSILRTVIISNLNKGNHGGVHSLSYYPLKIQ